MLSSIRKSFDYRIPVKLGLVIACFDVAALVLALLATLILPQLSDTVRDWVQFRPEAAVIESRIYAYGALCGFLMLAFAHAGHYSRRVPWWGQVQFICKALLLVLLVDGFTYFSFQHPFSRYLIMANWLFVAAFLLVARQVAFMLVALSKDWRIPLVLVGDREMVTDCMYAFYADGRTGYEVKVILLRDADESEFDLSFIPKAHPPIRLERIGNNYASFIKNNPDYFYVFSVEGFRGESRDTLINALEAADAEYAVIPSIKRLQLHGMEPHYFFGNDIMLLHKRHAIEMPLARAIKRLMDVAVASLALIPLGLVLLVVVVMRKIEGSSTPLFYGGERVGRGGKMFSCWKFCTMRTDGDKVLAELLEQDPAARAEWETFQKLKNDPRIDSRISAILRKTSLDELPQLWNVFVGDMSLVGPRPILENQKEEYGEVLSSYVSVRPGLTGLWQVSGRNETSFKQRVKWDAWYIKNWSLWHDVVILFKTARVVLNNSGAY